MTSSSSSAGLNRRFFGKAATLFDGVLNGLSDISDTLVFLVLKAAHPTLAGGFLVLLEYNPFVLHRLLVGDNL